MENCRQLVTVYDVTRCCCHRITVRARQVRDTPASWACPASCVEYVLQANTNQRSIYTRPTYLLQVLVHGSHSHTWSEYRRCGRRQECSISNEWKWKLEMGSFLAYVSIEFMPILVLQIFRYIFALITLEFLFHYLTVISYVSLNSFYTIRGESIAKENSFVWILMCVRCVPYFSLVWEVSVHISLAYRDLGFDA